MHLPRERVIRSVRGTCQSAECTPPSKARGKKSHRVICLTAQAREVIMRLCTEAPTGSLLRNARGNAWTKDAAGVRTVGGGEQYSTRTSLTPRIA